MEESSEADDLIKEEYDLQLEDADDGAPAPRLAGMRRRQPEGEEESESDTSGSENEDSSDSEDDTRPPRAEVTAHGLKWSHTPEDVRVNARVGLRYRGKLDCMPEWRVLSVSPGPDPIR